MKALSICSGIEAASVAWGTDIEVVAFAEIDPFASAVLAERFPHIPNLGDFTKITYEQIQEITGGAGIDVLIGGTPCQSFSIAGLRAGLDSPNGNLALGFIKLAARLRPKWVVWENVPGVFSSNGRRDFGRFLEGITGKSLPTPGKWQNFGVIQGIPDAYSLAGRVLDAKHFGVPQRRRRVFVVGHLGTDWRCAAAVLLERGSMQGDSAPSRKTGERSPGNPAGGPSGGDRPVVVFDPNQITSKANRSNPKPGDPCHTLPGQPNSPIIVHPGPVVYNIMPQKSGKDHKAKETDTAQTITTLGNGPGNTGTIVIVETGTGQPTDVHPTLDTQGWKVPSRNQTSVIICSLVGHGEYSESPPTLRASGGDCGGGSEALICMASEHSGAEIAENMGTTLMANHTKPIIFHGPTVRRLTPTEAARLQGFPDRWSRIPWNGKPAEFCPDGPQYKCYGNSMAVPVIRWVGERIVEVEKMQIR